MKLVGLSGSLSGSKTANIVNDVLKHSKLNYPEVETELIDLKDYEIEFVKGMPLQFYNNDTVTVVKKLLNADLIVISTPIYQASITGALKNLLDHLPVDAFKNKVTGIVTIAGTDKHFLVAEHQLKPILNFLKGIVPTGNIFVHSDLFDEDNQIDDPDYHRRIKKLVDEMLHLSKSLSV